MIFDARGTIGTGEESHDILFLTYFASVSITLMEEVYFKYIYPVSPDSVLIPELLILILT